MSSFSIAGRPAAWLPPLARVSITLWGFLASAVSMAPAGESPACPIQLRDVTAATGIAFRHTDGSSGRRYIVETVTAGLALFDYDGDGDIDIYFVNGAPTPGCRVDKPPRNALYRNDGQWRFTDVTDQAGVGDTGFGLGVAVADYDNDGDPDIYVNRDLFIANGHLQDNVELYDGTTAYEVANTLLMNNGKGKFIDISDRAGDGLAPKRSGRGAGLDDLDNDGRLDVVILNSRREPTILRNDSNSGNHWIQVQLRGTKTNRDGVGARVRLVAGDLALVDEVHSGRGYQSHHGTRLHFGLGNRGEIDRVEVRWIGGKSEVFEGAAADRILTLVEGAGRPQP